MGHTVMSIHHKWYHNHWSSRKLMPLTESRFPENEPCICLISSLYQLSCCLSWILLFDIKWKWWESLPCACMDTWLDPTVTHCVWHLEIREHLRPTAEFVHFCVRLSHCPKPLCHSKRSHWFMNYWWGKEGKKCSTCHACQNKFDFPSTLSHNVQLFSAVK